MKKEQLQYLVEVIDCGSINKAAERLYISQPSLSRSIHALESEMGKELIVRSNHGVSATPTGKVMYFYARSILSQFQVLERLKHIDEENLYSVISVSVDSIFLRDDLILQFYNRMQSADTEIHFVETTAERVLSNVSEMKSEIGITIINNVQLQIFKKMIELKEIDMEIIGTGPLYVHVNETMPVVQKAVDNKVEAKEFLDMVYIHLPYDFFSNLNRSIAVDGLQLTNFLKTITMSNYHAMLNMLNHTNAFMLGNKWQVEELRFSHIKSMQLKNCDIEEHFVIIKRKREVLSVAAKVFIDIIKENYENI